MMAMMTILFLPLVTLLLSNNLLWLVQGCQAFQIQSNTFEHKQHPIAYETAFRVYDETETKQPTTEETTTNGQPILMLNGFGVGSFHQHRLMPQLITVQDDDNNDNDDEEITRTIYGIDYLGQGQSWPKDCNDGNSESEQGLIYSIDTWADQVIDFIETVILPKHDGGRKLHVIGNSVGGHLAVILAARRPDLIESICLLNATPIWGFNMKGWSGHLPPPRLPRAIGRFLFDKIRDLGTIEKYLETAYANRDAFDETLIQQIRSCTEGPGGHAAFSSILYSPPANFTRGKTFYHELANLQCDVLLLFGKDDPWCTPAFGKRMFQCLQQRASSTGAVAGRYLELENVGHCPNHEAPTAVSKICRRWLQNHDRASVPLLKDDDDFSEEWGSIQAREVKDVSLSIMEKLITTFV